MNRNTTTFFSSCHGGGALKAMLWILLGFLIVGGTYLWIAQKDRPKPTDTQTFDSELETRALLTISTGSFKRKASNHSGDAILMWATESGQKKWHGIDVRMWDAPPSLAGWSIFFSSAFQINANTKPTSPIVGFYNPYTDLFLVTVWVKDHELYRITDAELLMGDWIRGGLSSENTFEIKPLWLRGDMHRPEKLGYSIAESVIAFERVFDGATATHWRDRISVLSDQHRFESINDPIAKLRLNEHLLNQMQFIQKTPPDSVIADCQRATEKLIQHGISGQIQEILHTAKGTLKNTADRLQRIDPQWFSLLQVAAVLTDPKRGIIFLSPPQVTNCSLAISIQNIGGTMQIHRVDLVDYQYFYKQIISRQKNNQTGDAK